MATNSLQTPPARGKCRICQRSRRAFVEVKAVSEVHKGFATGYKWECRDQVGCVSIAEHKAATHPNSVIRQRCRLALQKGPLTKYEVYT